MQCRKEGRKEEGGKGGGKERERQEARKGEK